MYLYFYSYIYRVDGSGLMKAGWWKRVEEIGLMICIYIYIYE